MEVFGQHGLHLCFDFFIGIDITFENIYIFKVAPVLLESTRRGTHAPIWEPLAYVVCV